VSIIASLREQSHGVSVYDHAGTPLHVKYKAVSSADLMVHGVASLLTVPGLSELLSGRGSGQQDPASIAARLGKAGPQAVKQLAQGKDALCCAAVVALSTDGETWERLELVMPHAPEAPDQEVPRLHCTILPYNIRQQLSRDIEAHSTGGRAAERALREFRDGSADAGHDSGSHEGDGANAAPNPPNGAGRSIVVPPDCAAP
jgi:hypothetical protein